ncbi:hypothetical protein Q0M94_07485 [Deinococcus radiomollis]|uniref:hypothetical protein n=1 Tax=Deinococcus radiomollis TaxID=468916 RepID=UPI0038922913
MNDELKDTAPLGKSVEEVEGEPQLQRTDNGGVLGNLLNPKTPQDRDSSDAAPSLLGTLGRSFGMDNDEAARSPDADKDSSEE